MKRFFLIALCMSFSMAVIFAKPGDVKYVNAQKAQLKSSTSFFGKKLGTVPYGEKLIVVSEEKKWTQIKPESQPTLTAWISNANITSKKVLANRGISNAEIALAGKGFSKSGKAFSADDDLNYAAVVAFEKESVPQSELTKFISAGRLSSRKSRKTFTSRIDISAEEEYEIGETVAAALLSVYSEQYAPKTKHYLNLIAQALVTPSPRPTMQYGYVVGILDTDEINAFATAGGHIMISRGMLDAAKTEDALAAVIAHEIAHIQLQHSVAALNKDRGRKEISNRMNSVLTEAFGESIHETDEWANEIRNSVDTLVNNGYSQTQEYEADAYAIELLENAGYDTVGMVDMLNLLKRTLNTYREFPEGGFSSTHPTPDNRLTKLKPIIGNPRASRNSERRTERFRQIFR